jgi:thioredoxin-like negative regulator of GroEL
LPRRYGDVAHWRQVALAASEQGETALALRCWQHVLRLQPEARDAEFHIACCQAVAGQREHAAEAFARLASDRVLNPELRRRALRLAQLLDAQNL